MNVLITGADGFVGGHLARLLLKSGHAELHGTTYHSPADYRELSEAGVKLHQADLTDTETVAQLLDEVHPKQVYHLAAMSDVGNSFKEPWKTLRNNIQGQLNILHQMVKLKIEARVLIVGSAEVYGPVSEDDIPINESQPFNPNSPYGVSKVTQDLLALQYFKSHHLETIRARPFNQIGPGQNTGFVATDFASQVAKIEKGLQEPVLHVGNLEARRDFTDVRDMVRAYELLMQHGNAGDVYNIGSGEAHSIQELLDVLLMLTDAPVEVRHDPARMRPSETPIVICDASKMRNLTGWKPEHTFEETLTDVLNDWRERI